MDQSKPRSKKGKKKKKVMQVTQGKRQKLTSTPSLFATLNSVCSGGPPVSAFMKMTAFWSK